MHSRQLGWTHSTSQYHPQQFRSGRVKQLVTGGLSASRDRIQSLGPAVFGFDPGWLTLPAAPVDSLVESEREDLVDKILT